MKKMELLSFSKALESALENCIPTQKTEIVLLDRLLGRILAEDLVVRKNLPSFDNSAMDGFAFRYADRGKRLRIKASIFAGETPRPILGENECYKIMTGAQVPSDADTIVPIEHCSDLSKTEVLIPEELKQGNALRHKGEELKDGDRLFCRGTCLAAGHIALLAAQGIMAARAYKPLEIALLSSGNEIREPWEQASEEEIYNANAFAIGSLLKRHGFTARYVGAISDDLGESVSLIAGLKSYDVVISTGGISMGEADFLKEAFRINGLVPLFHGVNVKPGHPTMMGKIEDTFVMAMPGNPLASMLNTFLLSLPLLFKMQGSSRYAHEFIYAKNRKAFELKAGRSNVVLGTIDQGEFTLTRDNRYGSGMLTPIVESNAAAIFGEEISRVEEGEMIKVILLESPLLGERNDSINQ